MEHQRKKRKKKFVQFLSLGHFLRTCAVLPRPHLERNDGLSSWKSLFFYRCTDTVLFAPLKSQPGRRMNAYTPSHVRARKGRKGVGRSLLSPEMKQQEKTETDSEPPIGGHEPAEPMKTEETMMPWENTKEEQRADYIRRKAVAAAPPPCSPKTIYVLANLVSQPSTEHLTHDTNTSHQARNSAPLR